MVNIRTYDDVEFSPGPQLNVIIGANGTGKSSIVCSIALGLGGRTQILGRARDPQDFVKHGKDTATIEIELNNKDGDNFTIRRKISRREKQSKWQINGRASNAKAVEELTSSLNIQMDNLCQFLPQDKVDEFARMNSKQLLESTEKAVGGIAMYENHCKLKTAREKSREMEADLAKLRETLDHEVSKNQRLEPEVKTIRQRQKHLDRISLLKQKLPWVEYEEKRHEYNNLKDKKKELDEEIKKAEELNKPLQNQLNKLNSQLQDIDKQIKKMVETVKTCSTAAAEMSKKIENETDKVDELVQDFESKKSEETKREQKIRELESQLQDLETQLEGLDIRDVQPQIQQVSSEMRSVNMELTQANQEGEHYRTDSETLKKEIKTLQAELRQLQDVANQRLHMLRAHSRDAHTAVMWLRENKHLLSGVVHEPIMTLLNVKDPQYTKFVESHISHKDMVAFVCEEASDQQLLLRTLREEQKLRINLLLMPKQPLSAFKPDVPISQYQRYGFFAFVCDLFTCPDAVMRYLYQMYQVYRVPVGNQYTKDHVQTVIKNCKELRSFYTEHDRYQVKVSKYNGERASMCYELRAPSVLTKIFDSVRDRQLKKDLKVKESELSELTMKMKDVHSRYKQLETQMTTLRNRKKALIDNRDSERQLNQRIKSKRQLIETQRSDIVSIEEEEARKDRQIKAICLRKLRIHEEMTQQIEKIWRINQDRTILTFKKSNLVDEGERIQEEQRQKGTLHQSLLREREKLTGTLNEKKGELRAQLASAKKASNIQSEKELPEELHEAFSRTKENTVEEIEAAIHEEQARAHMCATYAVDDQVVREFNSRKKKIADLEKSVVTQESKLETHAQSVIDVKAAWEEPVREMLSEINTKFSDLFHQMKCAGEVSLHVPEKPEDYAEYGIKLRVKYRNSEPLRELSAHTQSGGERSVATVLYMLALQEMTTCPFRCVDEINQGMDPINERKVFELVVNMSCRENTSQYFLLTPKLLPDLHYSDRMTVLSVWNGQHMLDHRLFNIPKFLGIRASLQDEMN